MITAEQLASIFAEELEADDFEEVNTYWFNLISREDDLVEDPDDLANADALGVVLKRVAARLNDE